MFKELRDKLKKRHRIKKIEREILELRVDKQFFGVPDTKTWWREIQELNKELEQAKKES